MAKNDSDKTVTCWLCDRTIAPDAPSHSLLGQGVFIVHVRCYERELHGPPRAQPPKRARRGGRGGG